MSHFQVNLSLFRELTFVFAPEDLGNVRAVTFPGSAHWTNNCRSVRCGMWNLSCSELGKGLNLQMGEEFKDCNHIIVSEPKHFPQITIKYQSDGEFRMWSIGNWVERINGKRTY